MGALLSIYTDKLYDEKIATRNLKNFGFWEWAEQEKVLRQYGLWRELKQGTRTNQVAALVKGVADNTKINRNMIYLVGGIVSEFYEEALDHQTKKLEDAYDQIQRDSILIDTLKAELAVADRANTSLIEKGKKVNTSSEQIPIDVEA
ncbi:hypothetical protein C1645_742478 [Glomus cerebriforme]|uniref:Uncharacterized protein n=1 Tax=Glomus cerebriforme TaxID=658196 RepID=A0A397SD88_9GLOM|nr:hypothetical protein C1645_742478 [Glomus cerebriforme]